MTPLITYQVKCYESVLTKAVYFEYLRLLPDPLSDDDSNIFANFDFNRGIHSILEVAVGVNKTNPITAEFNSNNILESRSKAFRFWLNKIIEKRKQKDFSPLTESHNFLEKNIDFEKIYSIDFLLIDNGEEFFLHSFYGKFHSHLTNLEREFYTYKQAGYTFRREDSYAGRAFTELRPFVEILDNASFGTRVTKVPQYHSYYVLPNSKKLAQKQID